MKRHVVGFVVVVVAALLVSGSARPELSVESQNAGGLALAWITTLEVAPGRLADWQAFMRERLPLFRGDNVVFGMYERYLGSGTAVWQLVENHSSFTELDRPTIMQRALGERTSASRPDWLAWSSRWNATCCGTTPR